MDRSRGFSLLELIVSGAIVTFMMMALGAIFMGSTRAVHQGFRHMDAYELIRGSDSILSRDLRSAYTSRDHGDVTNFFGTPYGMSFIATRATTQGIDINQGDNLCRITYVVRQMSSSPDTPDKLDAFDGEYGETPVWCLIRLVEDGVDALETYPFGWTSEWWDLNSGAEVEVLPQQVENLIQASESAEDYCVNMGFTAEATRQVVAAKRHELWLRMLRGNGPVRTQGGGWRTLELEGEQLPDYFALMGKDPRDFVVATNVSFSTEDIASAFDLERRIDLYDDPIEPTGLLCFGMLAFDYGKTIMATVKDPNNPDPSERPVDPIIRRPPFDLSKTRHDGAFQVTYNPFWGSSPQSLQAIDAWIDDPNNENEILYPRPYGGEGSPLLSRLPEVVHVRFEIKQAAPTVASRDVVKMFDRTYTIPCSYTTPDLFVSAP